jgi:hypothetical protein
MSGGRGARAGGKSDSAGSDSGGAKNGGAKSGNGAPAPVAESGTAGTEAYQDAEFPGLGNDRVGLTIVVIDAVLLAMLEVMFASLSIGTVPVPVSALVALVSTPWLVRAAGVLSRGVLGACAPLIGWVLTLGVLGFGGPGGDVLLTGDWPTLLLVVAGMVPAAYVLGRVLREKVGMDR